MSVLQALLIYHPPQPLLLLCAPESLHQLQRHFKEMDWFLSHLWAFESELAARG